MGAAIWRHLAVGLAVAVVVAASPALAYPWMAKHDYQSCAACHVDPSGAGQLTPYGRANSDTLLLWKPGQKPGAGGDGEVAPSTRFLWFIDLPEWLNLSGNLRGGGLMNASLGQGQPTVRPLLMAADLRAAVAVGPVVGQGTLGFGVRAPEAQVAPLCDASGLRVGTGGTGGGSPLPCMGLVAREYWLGVKLADEAVMVRAGRMNLPFGLRNNEHIAWVRSATRTDINTHQQLGASVAYNGDRLRGEVMGLAGNFQLGPDVYRERGYSLFAEYALLPKMFLGLSSLIAWSGAEVGADDLRAGNRMAHGLFYRWSPVQPLVVLAEANLLVRQRAGLVDNVGFVGFAQADVELMQGLHVMASLEGLHRGDGQRGPSLGGWLSAAWYPLPHVEVRLDTLYRRETAPGTDAVTNRIQVLGQVHVFL